MNIISGKLTFLKLQKKNHPYTFIISIAFMPFSNSKAMSASHRKGENRDR